MEFMDWQKLELSKASLVKKEVDQITARLQEVISNPAQPTPSPNLISSIQSRILELEQFYLTHGDDERAILFEKERLRLRKAIQPFYTSTTNSTVTGNGQDNRSVNSGARHHNNTSVGGSNTAVAQSNAASNAQSANTLVMKSSRASGSGSVANKSQSQSSRKSSQPLYNWEERSEQRNPREEILVDGVSFLPTPAQGLYMRNMTREETEYILHDKYVDFQIVLTQEEMTILAARKKAEKMDAKLGKSVAASSSVHNAIPYVDRKRIVQDMFRPDNPDKWIHAEGMRTFTK
jgi:hypothetical protein